MLIKTEAHLSVTKIENSQRKKKSGRKRNKSALNEGSPTKALNQGSKETNKSSKSGVTKLRPATCYLKAAKFNG